MNLMTDRPILKLDSEIIGMIAAGEVVENPASAIKELIENSLDAGASSVTIEIRDGGISYMRVSDNGTGIRNKDIRMAFERHATSKITKAQDLYDLHTLGFRGEALASIAAVSRVILTTRSKEDETGVRAYNEGGELQEIKEAASPLGTTIVVRDLFYNTPVRLKFLKKPNIEASKVADVVSRLILAHPDISFRLINNGKQVYASAGNGELKSAIFSIYGRDTAENVVRVVSEGSIAVNGYIGIGDEARSNRGRQTFIVNGRTIRSSVLSQALEEACRERVTVGHYPVCVLNVDMPVSMVDVNVHPNKLEVRFSNELLVSSTLCTVIRNALKTDAANNAPRLMVDSSPEKQTVLKASVSVIPTTTEEGIQQAQEFVQNKELKENDSLAKLSAFSTSPVQGNRMNELPNQGETEVRDFVRQTDLFASVSSTSFVDEQKTGRLQESSEGIKEQRSLAFIPYANDSFTKVESTAIREEATSQSSPNSVAAFKDKLDQYRIVGVLFHTYIVLENMEQVLFVDQHAAHERILYEKLMREIDMGVGSQALLSPLVVHVTPQEKERIENYRQEITASGYDIDDFGDNAYQIRAVPNVFGEPETKSAFLDMVDRLGELRVLATHQKRRDAILQMACKKAIKGGDKISDDEIIALLSDIANTDAPPTCPHGRPLFISLNKQELERRFKRINK